MDINRDRRRRPRRWDDDRPLLPVLMAGTLIGVIYGAIITATAIAIIQP